MKTTLKKIVYHFELEFVSIHLSRHYTPSSGSESKTIVASVTWTPVNNGTAWQFSNSVNKRKYYLPINDRDNLPYAECPNIQDSMTILKDSMRPKSHQMYDFWTR